MYAEIYILSQQINHYKYLSSILNISEHDILKNKYGKPFCDKTDKSFSVSKTKNNVVIAVSECNVGIDVELLKAQAAFTNYIYYNLFYPDSLKKLAYWTQLEAYLKLLGYGLYFGVDVNFLEKIIFCKNFFINGFTVSEFRINKRYIYSFYLNKITAISLATSQQIKQLYITEQ